MQLADMLKLAYKALVDRKMRSVLTILGIAVGSAIILALIASSSGLNANITGSIEKTGANVLTLRKCRGILFTRRHDQLSAESAGLGLPDNDTRRGCSLPILQLFFHSTWWNFASSEHRRDGPISPSNTLQGTDC